MLPSNLHLAELQPEQEVLVTPFDLDLTSQLAKSPLYIQVIDPRMSSYDVSEVKKSKQKDSVVSFVEAIMYDLEPNENQQFDRIFVKIGAVNDKEVYKFVLSVIAHLRNKGILFMTIDASYTPVISEWANAGLQIALIHKESEMVNIFKVIKE